jgi:hypothetical protein|mmetsp:Transcript_36934/g.48567  ORF Transcript_36934/g.48567 Transcript_36934/m.48567 type:complete len:122 (-) Transcript_36934:425-790(-)|eukprot:CAMPEP_0185581018 /NCGR_PEP_ID=MMETSP0434-20130131/18052_1 /TAXON_ID=626734 ORGANISM="Favella taraikaensis, Strain Fe Narragansett Bay" /NCGR_SAMPLE_ID=MMETSP0434 /ASSEMBLY_ACC=CAM_ASM_000379 /LENGTH=121 /DNA_ID=CAMNT_0028199453 /DNA_START=395 /DNA_END=760 /DNA_ORIENTATION=+
MHDNQADYNTGNELALDPWMDLPMKLPESSLCSAEVSVDLLSCKSASQEPFSCDPLIEHQKKAAPARKNQPKRLSHKGQDFTEKLMRAKSSAETMDQSSTSSQKKNLHPCVGTVKMAFKDY